MRSPALATLTSAHVSSSRLAASLLIPTTTVLLPLPTAGDAAAAGSNPPPPPPPPPRAGCYRRGDAGGPPSRLRATQVSRRLALSFSSSLSSRPVECCSLLALAAWGPRSGGAPPRLGRGEGGGMVAMARPRGALVNVGGRGFDVASRRRRVCLD